MRLVYILMWLPKLLWEQVAVPLWKGPPTLTHELMELVDQGPDQPRRMQ